MTPALFVARGSRRISARSVDHIIRTTGRDAGLEIFPHVLRHTFATNLELGDRFLFLGVEDQDVVVTVAGAAPCRGSRMVEVEVPMEADPCPRLPRESIAPEDVVADLA